jgi:hypothetical protein
MIWALLILLGVPLWLCALGITALVYRNRLLRTRRGDIPVRVLRPGKKRWMRGHALWVSEVFAFRGSPAAWNEDLHLITRVSLAEATPADSKALHRMGEGVVVASLTTDDNTVLRVATAAAHRSPVLGPFAPHADPVELRD